MAIVSFSKRSDHDFFVTGKVAKRCPWQGIASLVRRKLDMLNYAHQLVDLRSPPGNRLEALKGGLEGLHSIRINDQWRITFRWTPLGPADVEVRDYH